MNMRYRAPLQFLQGRIYSISGNTPGYPSLYDTAFRHGYSVIRPNLRHRFFPYNHSSHTEEENSQLHHATERSWNDDTTGGIDEKQLETYREQYAKRQMRGRTTSEEIPNSSRNSKQFWVQKICPKPLINSKRWSILKEQNLKNLKKLKSKSKTI